MIVHILIPAIVVLLMVIVGTGLQPKQFTAILHFPVSLLGGTLSQLILLPLGALGIIFLLKPSPELSAGLLLVAACPGGALSNYYCHLGRLNVALSVLMTAVSSILSFISLPVVISIIFPLITTIDYVSIPVSGLIQRLFVMLLLPIGIGMLIHECLPGFVERHAIRMRVIGMILVVLLLALIVFDRI